MRKGNQAERCQLSPLNRGLSWPLTFLTPYQLSRIPKTSILGLLCQSGGSMASSVPHPHPGLKDYIQVHSLEPHRLNRNSLAQIKQAETKPGKARMQMLQNNSALRKCHSPQAGTGDGGQARKFPAPSEFTENLVPTLVIGMFKNTTTRLPDGEVGTNG